MSYPARTVDGEIVEIVAKMSSDEQDGLVIFEDTEGNKWMRRQDADDAHALEPYVAGSFEVVGEPEAEEPVVEEEGQSDYQYGNDGEGYADYS